MTALLKRKAAAVDDSFTAFKRLETDGARVCCQG